MHFKHSIPHVQAVHVQLSYAWPVYSLVNVLKQLLLRESSQGFKPVTDRFLNIELAPPIRSFFSKHMYTVRTSACVCFHLPSTRCTNASKADYIIRSSQCTFSTPKPFRSIAVRIYWPTKDTESFVEFSI